MDVRFEIKIPEKFAKKFTRVMAEGAMGGAHQVAHDILQRGRADIRRSYPGMSGGMANALRAKVYPERGISPYPTILIYHNAHYEGVFEYGESYAGKLMWAPTQDAIRLFGRNARKILRIGPSNRVTKLTLIKGSNGRPMLAAIVPVGKNNVARKFGKRTKLATSKSLRAVILFIGIRRWTISPNWHIRAVTATESRKLTTLYKERLGAW